jgi:hypothetical protein
LSEEQSRALTDGQRARPGRRRDIAVVLASLLVACGAFRAWRVAHHAPGIDFYDYWLVGRVVGRGDIPSIYEPGSRAALGQEFLRRALAEGSPRQRAAAQFRRVLEPTSTPFLYATLAPFARAHYDASFDVYLAFSLASLLAALFTFGRLVGQTRLERLSLIALVVYAFQPMHSDLRVGNVSQLQLALLAVYAWLGAGGGATRQVGAGAVLGAAVAFKPSIVVIAPLLFAWWALAKQWRRLLRQAAGFALGGLVAVLLGALWFGSLHAWTDWLAALGSAGLPAMAVESGNVSVLAVTKRWSGVALGGLPAVATSLAVLAALWVRRKSVRTGGRAEAEAPAVEDVLLIGAGCLVVLLSSPLVWLHYLILALPAVIVLLRPQARWRWPALAAFVAVAMDPWTDPFGASDPLRQATVAIAGLVLLFVLVLLEIASAQNHAGRQVEM